MPEVAEKIEEFKKTISTAVMISQIERGYYDFNLTWFFDKYPDFDVRKAILRRWLDHSVPVDHHMADWIEQRVHDLKKEEAVSGDFWEDLLSWYVFNSDAKHVFGGGNVSIELISRAVNFAIGITEKDLFGDSHSCFYRSDILKIVVGRLNNTPSIYEDIKTSSLKLFLESFLMQEYESKWDIIDYELINVKRVVRCAIKVKDWTFLPLIEKVLSKLYQSVENQIKKERYDFEREVVILQAEAFLKEAIRFMKEKMQEE